MIKNPPVSRRLSSFLLSLTFLTWGCGDSAAGPSERSSATQIGVQSSMTVELTDTITPEVYVTDSLGAILDSVTLTWHSSAPSVVQVTQTGLITARQVGTALVTVSVGRLSDTIFVTVPPPAARIVIFLVDSLAVPDGTLISFQVFDSAGVELGDRYPVVTLQDTNAIRSAASASWGPYGIQARAPGIGRVKLRLGVISALDSVRVLPRPVSIALKNVPSFMFVADSVRLNAELRDSLGNVLAGRGVEWSGDGITAGGVVSSLGVRTLSVAASVRVGGLPLSATASIPVRMKGAVTDVAAGYNHTCFLTESATLYCSGFNSTGEAGSNYGPAGLPRVVDGGLHFRRIAAGWHTQCGLVLTGEAWCWGAGQVGQLGAPTTLNCGGTPCVTSPVVVTGSHQFVDLAGKYETFCALTAAGRAWCWGSNNMGQLGLGTPDAGPHAAPEPVDQGSTVFTQLALSTWLACGLDTSGAAWCWGGGSDAPYDWTPRPLLARPTRIEGYSFKNLRGGQFQICGVATTSEAVCWGKADGNALAAPTAVPLSGPFAEVADAYLHTCALRTDGTAWCWGNDSEGGRGDGTGVTPFDAPPTQVTGGLRFSALWSGYDQSCGLDTSEVVWCWGDNGDYQLGTTTFTTFVPARVEGQP